VEGVRDSRQDRTAEGAISLRVGVERKNKTFIDGFSEILRGVSTPQEEAEKLVVKFGFPDGI
jgi:hypothetical protein